MYLTTLVDQYGKLHDYFSRCEIYQQIKNPFRIKRKVLKLEMEEEMSKPDKNTCKVITKLALPKMNKHWKHSLSSQEQGREMYYYHF